MRHDILLRRPCCGVSVTISGIPSGTEAYAETETVRLMQKLCGHPGNEFQVQYVPSHWTYTPPDGQALANIELPKQRGKVQ